MTDKSAWLWGLDALSTAENDRYIRLYLSLFKEPISVLYDPNSTSM